MKVKDCKLSKPETCNKETKVIELAKKFKETVSRYIIVMENEIPIGAVSSSDIVLKIVAEGKSLDLPASEIMASPILVLSENEDLHKALVAMIKKGLNLCPVVDDNNEIKGNINILDMIKKLNKV